MTNDKYSDLSVWILGKVFNQIIQISAQNMSQIAGKGALDFKVFRGSMSPWQERFLDFWIRHCSVFNGNGIQVSPLQYIHIGQMNIHLTYMIINLTFDLLWELGPVTGCGDIAYSQTEDGWPQWRAWNIFSLQLTQLVAICFSPPMVHGQWRIRGGGRTHPPPTPAIIW